MAKHKTPDNSIKPNHIKKIHLMLSDIKTGEEILGFLKATEPIFMEEVNRFISTEIGRLRYNMSESQATYVGSIIGATYIAGFLIAREGTNDMFEGLLDTKSVIKEALTTEEIDKIIDRGCDEGKTYKEISELIRNKLHRKTPKNKVKQEKKSKDKAKWKRLDLGDLS